MKNTLPKSLKKEPLIDAIFEVRFDSVSIPSFLLGLVYQKLEGQKVIENLPASQIPQMMRDEDLNLRYVPLHRISYDQFYINIGDRCVSVSCKMPYPKWPNFKPIIMRVMNILKESDIINNCERYSLKYIDLLPIIDPGEQVSCLNLNLTLAGYKLKNNFFQIRFEVSENEFQHIIQVTSSATATLSNGETRKGLVIDIDSVANQAGVKFTDFFDKLSQNLEVIHDENKKLFFKCLKQPTINSLEPIDD